MSARWRPVAWGGAAVVFGVGAYGGMLVRSVHRLPLPPDDVADPAHQPAVPIARWDALAPEFDDAVSWTETLVGIAATRRFLARKAHGDVLEVGAGTGRNTPLLVANPRVRTLTLTDSSAGMLSIAHAGYISLVQRARSRIRSRPPPSLLPSSSSSTITSTSTPQKPSLEETSPIPSSTTSESTSVATTTSSTSLIGVPPARFETAQAEALPFPDNSFDTVVDTFGLCAVADPAAALREMQRVCRPGGTILLLEHGRSESLPWLASMLDRSAAAHADRWGCWWNRDVAGLVRASGLDIREMRHFHFGTSLSVVARPSA